MVNKNSFKHLPKLIAQIYFSDMTEDLKNDCICRIICKEFNAGCVSMLHYEGAGNKLVCIGNFIDCNNISITYNYDSVIHKDTIENIPVIINNIPVFEYLIHIQNTIKTSTNLISYQHFKSHLFFDFDITEELFNKILNNLDSYLKSYTEYRSLFSENVIDVGKSNNPSAVYYRGLVCDITDSRKAYYQYTGELPIDEKQFLKLLSDKIGLVTNNNWYVGIPLIANKRFFGIMRILLNDENKKYFEQKEDEAISIAEIISLYYGNQYSLDKFKKLSLHDYVLKNRIKYNELSESLRSALNCHGCIIRLYDNNKKRSKIVGYTSKIESYIKHALIKDPLFPDASKSNNNMSINYIFNNEGNNQTNEQIIALKLNIRNIEKPTYYYTFKNENIIKTKSWNTIRNTHDPDLSYIYNNDFIRILLNNNIEEIVLIPIPGIKHSYVSFANTAYRFFTTNDIEVVYPIIVRLSLELIHKLDKKKIEIEKQWKQYYNKLIIFYHDISLPISELYSWTKLSINSNKVDKTIEIAHLMADYAQKYLHYSIEIPEEFGRKNELLKASWNLNTELNSLIKIFGHLLEVKKTKISYSYASDNDYVNISKSKLMFILFNLLTNAKKYCLTYEEVKQKDLLKSSLKTSEIIFDVNRIGEILNIKIGNYSEIINKKELNKIGKRNFRTEFAIKNCMGSGNGLFYIKKYVSQLHGTFSFEHSNYYTQVLLSIDLSKISI